MVVIRGALYVKNYVEWKEIENMLRVIEAFSGIGAQKQALLDSGIEHEIINTIEWDINAIYAYDKMHNGDKEPSKHSKPEILEKLSNLTLSSDGKNPMKEKTLSRMNEEKLQRLYGAIERNRNLCDITKVKGEDIPDDIDLLTYSFPCQDLSQASIFQNKDSKGIEKGAGTRSGLLWEVERILQEKFYKKETLPKFLLMENVNAINSPKHNKNFYTWQTELNRMGYENRIYERLNAIDFGVPQKRSRTFMLSVRIDKFSYEEVATKIPDKFKSRVPLITTN
ncbi:DNA cytosine methyltransferase [Lactococcus laudensis]|uniref:DNA cytosine methyltransferase n=1 Tax=Pseudolactococcus laudensis TaxID=1494461 RepID=UPI002FC65D66